MNTELLDRSGKQTDDAIALANDALKMVETLIAQRDALVREARLAVAMMQTAGMGFNETGLRDAIKLATGH
jgi:hypothetical protein